MAGSGAKTGEYCGFCAKFAKTVGKRSPVLGYNHNFKHRGLIFHVQTEDSGVDNPHLFTHLFHGGVIISSRKIDYDSDSEVDVVKALMQSQHKAVVKDLKIGTFDNKIDSYLGNRDDLEPRKADSAAGPAGEDTDPDAEAQLAAADAPAPSGLLTLDDAPLDDPEGLTFDAISDTQASKMREPINIGDEAASTDEMPSISMEAEEPPAASRARETPTADVDTEALVAVAAAEAQMEAMAAEAQAAIENARELAAQAQAEAAHAKELQEAATAAIARAEELEARAAAQKTGAHATVAHSGAISLGHSPASLPPQSFDSATPSISQDTESRPVFVEADASGKRGQLPTASEMPGQSDDVLGDPTVTFNAGGGKPPPRRAGSKPELQAVPEQVIGERSGTYSMKRQSPTERIGKRRQSSTQTRRARTGSNPVVTPPSPGTQPRRARTGSNPVASPPSPGTQPRRARTGSNPVASAAPSPARAARRSATGKAANPEPGRPRSPVVVSRPAVIIGAPPKMVGKGGRRPAARKARGGSVFGKDLISEKSLDEVIMAYLSEDSSEE